MGSALTADLLPGATPFTSVHGPRMRTRWIRPPDPAGWADVAVSEWELRAAGWSDRHPFSETNIVVAGELHVSCDDGPTVIAGPGDTVVVAAGVTGRYWAPEYARMYGIYGPNPGAEATEALGYWEL